MSLWDRVLWALVKTTWGAALTAFALFWSEHHSAVRMGP